MRVKLIFRRNVEMIVVVELKKRMCSIHILSIVICKFSHGQEFCSVVLLSIDKNTQISLHYTVLSLDLTVYLRMKYSKELSFNAKKVA